jgi:hypothetical protein
MSKIIYWLFTFIFITSIYSCSHTQPEEIPIKVNPFENLVGSWKAISFVDHKWVHHGRGEFQKYTIENNKLYSIGNYILGFDSLVATSDTLELQSFVSTTLTNDSILYIKESYRGINKSGGEVEFNYLDGITLKEGKSFYGYSNNNWSINSGMDIITRHYYDVGCWCYIQDRTLIKIK